MIKTEDLVKKVREDIVKFGFNSGSSAHYGGALSMADFLTTLYNEFIDQPKNLKETLDRDYFILSKGHAALGLYSVLFNCNYFDKTIFDTYLKNETKLIAHPIKNLPIGIESSNGSLGQGLSMGIGIALSYLKTNRKGEIFVLVGDGECYEGSIWEADISAVELNLDNLTVIVDCNGFQNDGAIGKAMNFESISKKWEGFGWKCSICDGHNINEIIKALNTKSDGIPKAVLAKTTKGKGISFMEKGIHDYPGVHFCS